MVFAVRAVAVVVPLMEAAHWLWTVATWRRVFFLWLAVVVGGGSVMSSLVDGSEVKGVVQDAAVGWTKTSVEAYAVHNVELDPFSHKELLRDSLVQCKTVGDDEWLTCFGRHVFLRSEAKIQVEDAFYGPPPKVHVYFLEELLQSVPKAVENLEWSLEYDYARDGYEYISVQALEVAVRATAAEVRKTRRKWKSDNDELMQANRKHCEDISAYRRLMGDTKLACEERADLDTMNSYALEVLNRNIRSALVHSKFEADVVDWLWDKIWNDRKVFAPLWPIAEAVWDFVVAAVLGRWEHVVTAVVRRSEDLATAVVEVLLLLLLILQHWFQTVWEAVQWEVVVSGVIDFLANFLADWRCVVMLLAFVLIWEYQPWKSKTKPGVTYM